MGKQTIDPDRTRIDDSAYWAAAFVVAVRADDLYRAEQARSRLRELGFKIDQVKPRRKAVENDR